MLRFSQIHPLRLILALGLLHGLLYIFFVPPWQHYDEPTHFEYAWLIANRLELPMPGEFDQPMRRAVAASMIEYNFFRGMNFLPNLNAQNEPVWIGISQLDSPPFYYLLVSLPIQLFSSWNVTWQLYIGRFVSLGLYLLSIVAAWGTMREIVPERHPLQWMVPISIVLLPSYTDLMTSINNDVGATILFSMFLWGSIRMIRQGFTFQVLLWVISISLLCYWTKSTVFLTLPLLGIVILISFFRSRWHWVPWVMLIVAFLAILVSTLSWGDALFWIRSPNTLQKTPTRTLSTQTPFGKHVLRMEITPGKASPMIFQLLPADRINAIRGKEVTLGAWIWATRPLNMNALTLDDGQQSFSHAFQIGTSPEFFALSVTLTTDASHAQVILTPGNQENSGADTVFYDGLVLVEGVYPINTIPQFNDVDAEQGTWGGQVFSNLLHNASGEMAGPGIRPWPVENRPQLLIYSSPELVLGSLLDWRGAGWYYRVTAQNLLQTFWAKFGWGHIPLSLPFTNQPYLLLTVFTFAGLGGAGITLLRHRLALPWNMLMFLGFTLAGVWGLATLRGIHSLAYSGSFIPSARYAYPVIIPTMLLLNAGWLEIAYFLERWIPSVSSVKSKIYFLFFLGLDIAALSTVFYYYYIR